MATFVKLTDRSGGAVWVNLDHALTLSLGVQGTQLNFGGGDAERYGDTVTVVETPDQIETLYAEAIVRHDDLVHDAVQRRASGGEGSS